MEFFAILGGASAKIYDDIIDNNIPMNETILESLKGLQWITLSTMSINDFNFTAVMYAFCLFNWFVNPEAFGIPYEHALLIVYPLFMLWNFPTASSFSFLDGVSIILIICIAMFEPILHLFIDYSEGSIEKLLIRYIVGVGTMASILIGYDMGISSSILKFMIYSLSYVICSVGFQAYILQNGFPTGM